MKKHKNEHLLLKILLALLPTLIFVQNYAWMTANKAVGIVFIILWAFIIFTAWSFTERNHIFERYFRLTEVGLFLMPLSGLIMTFVLGSQAMGSTTDELSQAGAAIGTAIGGTFIVGIAFVVGIPVGIIMHLVANNYSKKADASGIKQPETFMNKHGIISSVGVLLLLAIILGTTLPAPAATDMTSQTGGVNQEEIGAEASEPLLELLNYSGSRSYGYITVEGEVKNISSEKMESVVAVVSAYDINGEFITSSDALIDYNPILADQTSPFTVMIQDNPAIENYTVEFKKFWGGTIETKHE